MFTGIISDIGEIVAVSGEHPRRFDIASSYRAESIPLGGSISCDGVCLTVIDRMTQNGRHFFAVEACAETLSCSTAAVWEVGSKLNLERAMQLGDELGGHIVSGHVDAVARVIKIKNPCDPCDGRDPRNEGDESGRVFHIEPPRALMGLIAEKGSVCLNGASFTVNKCTDSYFTIMLIPHTLAVTNWADLQENAQVNLEIDMLARYVARALEFQASKPLEPES